MAVMITYYACLAKTLLQALTFAPRVSVPWNLEMMALSEAVLSLATSLRIYASQRHEAVLPSLAVDTIEMVIAHNVLQWRMFAPQNASSDHFQSNELRMDQLEIFIIDVIHVYGPITSDTEYKPSDAICDGYIKTSKECIVLQSLYAACVRAKFHWAVGDFSATMLLQEFWDFYVWPHIQEREGRSADSKWKPLNSWSAFTSSPTAHGAFRSLETSMSNIRKSVRGGLAHTLPLAHEPSMLYIYIYILECPTYSVFLVESYTGPAAQESPFPSLAQARHEAESRE